MPEAVVVESIPAEDQPGRRGRPDTVTALVRHVFPVLLLFLTYGLLARKALSSLGNADMFLHLRIGDEFLHGGWRPWHTGHVGSLEHNDWVPTQWLSQIVMAATEDRLGLPGMAWLSGSMFVVLALALFLVARRETSMLPAAVLVLPAVIACMPSLSPRPQVVSYLFVAITMSAWQAARRSRRPPWVLVPLTWVWAMCHGMWPLGLVISAAAVLGIALDRSTDRRTLVRMGLVPVLAAIATALTPVGPRLLGAVLLVNSRGEYFTEWDPPDFTSRHCLALLVLLVTAVVLFARQRVTTWFDLALLVVALGFAVYSERTVPVAAVMLVPLIARALESRMRDRSAPRRTERILAIGGAVVAIVGLAVAARSTTSSLEPPTWMGRELAAAPSHQPVLTDMSVGSYLLWRYPELDLVEHGYADVYTTRELDEHRTIDNVLPGWDRLVRATGAELAVQKPGTPLTYALELAGWTVVRADDDVVLLKAPADWLTSGQTS